MAWLILAGIVALPVIEIALFVKSADLIGVMATVALAVLAVTSGGILLRQQGLALLWRARGQLAQGQMPVDEAFDGLCLAVAGFLLILPGFLTDAMALVLLLPPVRRSLRSWLGRAVVTSPPGTIDAEYHVIEDAKDRH